METNSSLATALHPAHPALVPDARAVDAGTRHAGPGRTASALRPYQQVAQRVIDLAMQLALGAGERLPSERELATALGVSRATLRQALTSLELGGIVEVRSCSGVYLCAALRSARPVPQAIPGPFEVLSARRLLEPELAAMAARVATDSSIDAILAAAGEMERLQRETPEDTAGGELADRHFHLTLARATGNGALVNMLEHLWSECGGLWHTLEQLFQTAELRQETLADYRRIGCAVAERNPAGARSAMRAHLERYTRTLSRK